MKKHGILNSSISKMLADLGHTDQFTIGDAGLPVPCQVEKIDLALKPGYPDFITVLEAVLADVHVEEVFLAEEILAENPAQAQAITALVGDVPISYISHDDFKKLTGASKAVIRTGEVTPYSNIIIQSATSF